MCYKHKETGAPATSSEHMYQKWTNGNPLFAFVFSQLPVLGEVLGVFNAQAKFLGTHLHHDDSA